MIGVVPGGSKPEGGSAAGCVWRLAPLRGEMLLNPAANHGKVGNEETRESPPGPPYERLDAWRACHELSLVVYRSTRNWSASERYGLIAQVRRAAVSASANLVEGASRTGSKELKRFVEIALGSLAELEYLLMLASEIGLIDSDEHSLLRGFVGGAGQLTGGLHRALRRRVS